MLRRHKDKLASAAPKVVEHISWHKLECGEERRWRQELTEHELRGRGTGSLHLIGSIALADHPAFVVAALAVQLIGPTEERGVHRINYQRGVSALSARINISACCLV